MSPADPPRPAFPGRGILRTVLWILAAAFLFNGIFGDMGLIQGLRQRRAASQMRREVAALQERNAALAADVDQLLKSSYRIEAIAREELGLGRPGELLFLFPEDRRGAEDDQRSR